MKKIVFLIGLLDCICTFISAQNTSGLLIGGGAGTLNTRFEDNIPPSCVGVAYNGTYNFDLHVGYRYRLTQGNRLFWDLDALTGLESIQEARFEGYSGYNTIHQEGDRVLHYYVALAPSANLRIVKGLYAGLGVAPTLYCDDIDFDLPLTVKAGYDWDAIGLEASFNVGLLRDGQESLLKSNRKKEFQLTLYIPLWK